MRLNDAKVALVFDWMTNMGGAEKVNLKLHQMFPDAPIFTSIFNKDKIEGFEDAKINTSFIQKLPYAKEHHQWYLSMMPYAYELFDLSKFDIVISSCHSCSKGVITKPETLHVCYCHTPMRYAWDDWQTYINDYKTNGLIKKIAKRKLHKIRIWDKLASERVDYFIANSRTTQKRIEKYYRRPSTVIQPMVDTSKFTIKDSPKGYFLAVGRLIPYKKFDLLVEAFNELGLPLKIAGTGLMEPYLQKIAKQNIEFLGHVDEEELKRLYQGAEALVFPQTEDFGIVPLEAMACGRPVIAYRDGGATETVIENKTGIFFDKQDVVHLRTAVEKFVERKKDFDAKEIRAHAETFDEESFERKLSKHLQSKWEVRTSQSEDSHKI